VALACLVSWCGTANALADPLEPLASRSVFIPAGSTAVTTAAGLLITSGLRILASQQWEGKSVNAVLELPTAGLNLAGSMPSDRNASVIVCAGGQAPLASVPFLVELSQDAALIVRDINFVGCARIFRTTDRSSLSLVAVAFDSAWRILHASTSSSAKLAAISVQNSTLGYSSVLQAAASAVGNDALCGPISLFCMEGASNIVAVGMSAQLIGIQEQDQIPSQRAADFRSNASLLLASGASPQDLQDRSRFLDGLVGGALLTIRDAAVALLENVIVSQARAERGAVFLSTSSSRLRCVNCHFANNTAVLSGGVGSLGNTSSAEFSSCTLVKNRAAYGAFAWIQDQALLTIDRCVIANGTADFSAGGIAAIMTSRAVLSNVTASGNSAPIAGGFLVASDSANVTVSSQSLISGNSADSGGAFAILVSATLTISESSCVGNRAELWGGCIRGRGSPSIIIRGGSQSSNIATRGGFLCLRGGQGGGSLFFDGIACNSNMASNGLQPVALLNSTGGCIDAWNATVRVRDSIFSNNSAVDELPSDDTDGRGGAFYIDESSIQIDGSSFHRNWADLLGGAINFLNCSFLGKDLAFVGNVATYKLPTFLRQNGAGDDNRDEVYGHAGALGAVGGSFLLEDSSFISNQADYAGGCVAFERNNATFKDCLFLNNTSMVWGGAIYFFGTGNNSLSLQGTKCFGNLALVGGCLHAEMGVSIDLKDMEIIGNMAPRQNSFLPRLHRYKSLGYGGALTFLRVQGARAFNCSAFLNSAGYSGGVFFVQESTAIFTDVVAKFNEAMRGGFIAVYGRKSIVTISRMLCDENMARDADGFRQGLGGCVHIEFGESVTIANSSIRRNKAYVPLGSDEGFGGAIYSQQWSKIMLRNVTIQENKAENAGGIFFLDPAYVSVEATLFSGNVGTKLHETAADIILAHYFESTDVVTLVLFSDTIFSGSFPNSVWIDKVPFVQASFARCRWHSGTGASVIVRADVDAAVDFVDCEISNASSPQILQAVSGSRVSPLRISMLNTRIKDIFAADDAETSLIYNEGSLMALFNCTFERIMLERAVAIIQLTENAQVDMKDVSVRIASAKSLLDSKGTSFATLSNITIGQGVVCERGVVSTDQRAKLEIDGMSVDDSRSRCGIVACIESADSIRMTNVRVTRSACLGGNPQLSFFSVDCAIVVSRAASAAVLLSNLVVDGFRSWTAFVLLDRGGSVSIVNASVANFPQGGGFRVLSIDGHGRFSASGVSFASGSMMEGESVFYLQTISFPSASGFIADISNVSIGSITQKGRGAVVSLLPPASVSAATTDLGAGLQANVTVRLFGISARDVTSDSGGALLFCSGRSWNVSLDLVNWAVGVGRFRLREDARLRFPP
jgi:hypothetical protein